MCTAGSVGGNRINDKNIRVKAIGNAYVKDLQQEFFFHMLLADYAGGTLKTSDEDGRFEWLTKKKSSN